MSVAVTVHTEVDQAAVANLQHEQWLRDALQNIAEAKLVPVARDLAPVRRRGHSRGGAASIRAEPGHDERGFYVDVSWDAAHAYMRFPDLGTRRGVRAEHFLERAVHQAEQHG